MFTKGFGPFASHHDTIHCEVDGYDATATLYHDSDAGRPDERDDGFWPSLDPKSAGYIGPKSKSTLARHMAKAKAVMKAWENDEWHFVGVAVTVERAGVRLTGTYSNALWGVECNYPGTKNEYLLDVANELLEQALVDARKKIEALAASIKADA